MGLVESFKRAFNISGAEITVSLDDAVLSQNDAISGEVAIAGGQLDQSGKAITLELKEYWTESQYNAATKTTTTVTRYRTQDTVNLAGAFTVAPRSEQRFRFETKLPLNSRISTSSTGWVIQVSLDIPGAVDPRGHVKLDVLPCEEMAAVLETCESVMRFEESARHRQWNSKTQETWFRMIPPQALKKELDYLRLQLLQTDDGGLSGELVFDLQEKSIGDYFKAIFNQDKVKEPLALSREQLFLPEGAANTQAIAEAIGSAMVKVIADHNK